MAVVFKNNAKTTLASGITSSATSITVADGSVFPTLTGSDTFFCTLDDGTNIEIVEVTAISSNTLTVTRAQDNTSATSFSTGTVAELRLTAGILNLFSQTGSDINAEVEAYLDANGTTFPDNIKAQFGASNDLQIFHNGTNSYISQAGTGHLYIRNTTDDNDIIFASDDGSGGTSTYFTVDGSNERVVFSKSVNFQDNIRARFGNSNDLHIYHDTTDTRIENITGDLLVINKADDGDIKFKSDDGSGGTTDYFQIDGTNEIVKSFKDFNITGALQINGTQVISSARNLTNIGTISSGDITIADGTTYKQSTDMLYIGGDGLNSADASIYIGNVGNGNGYGWRLFYEGSGDSNNNKFIIKSENNNSPVDALSFTQDGNATFSGTISSGAITASSHINLTAGQVKLRNDVALDHDGSSLYIKAPSVIYFYPGNTNHGNLNTSGTLTVKAYQVNGTTVIDSSRNLTNIGTISSGVLSVNGGTTNVVATFQSTDGIAGIKLQDSGGNVELSASGSTFRVQPSGGTAVLEVDSSGNTDIAGTISSGAITTSGETLSISHTGNTSTISLTQKAGTQNSVATISANREDTTTSASRLLFSTNDGTSTLQRMRINNGGDISFYEDTGTTAKLFWDASAERLGIGETSVDAKLHLTTATAGLINQKFESAGSAAWRIGIPASQTYFAFDNANDDLSSPKVVIDSSGNLLVGQTTASSGTVGTSLRSDGRTFFCADGNYAAHFNRNTSDGVIAHFAKDDNVVGSIGTKAGGLTIGNGDTGLRMQDSINAIYAYDTSTDTNRDSAIDLGAASVKWKDLYLSGYVSATALASPDGTQIVFPNNNGNVMIGSTGTPSAKLHVSGTINSGAITSTGVFTIDEELSGDASQLVITNTQGATLRMGITGSDANEAAHIKTNSGEALEFHIGQAANASTPDITFLANGGGIAIQGSTIIDSSANLTNIGTINTSVAMGSSPTNIIYMAMSGNNTNGGGGAIRFDTSATNTDTSMYYASVEGIRSSSGNGSNELAFFTAKQGVNSNAPTRKMTIDEDGRVLIGTTDAGLSSSSSTTGINLRPNSASAFTRSGGTALYINRLTDDGDLVTFRRDGVNVGVISTKNGEFSIGHGDTGILFNETVNAVYPWNVSTNDGSDGSLDLGISTRRWKDLHISGTANTGNIVTTGYLRGPATFTIDPATHGDDTGTVVIAGNLQVDGTTTTVNSTTVNVSDKAITLGYDATTDAANNQAGIIVYRPETSNAQILWNETNTRFEINRKVNISQHFTVDASGTNDTMVEIGSGTASNHYAYIDLIGDSTYSDYGLRVIRNNSGANTTSAIYHRGTGNFNIETQDSASLLLRTAGATALTLDTSQNATFAGTITANGKITSTELTITGGSDGEDIYINNTSPTLGFTDSNSFSDSNDVYLIRGASTGKLQFQFYDNSANTTTQTFLIDESGNTDIAGTIDSGAITSTGAIKAYGNSDTVAALEIYSNSNHGMRILHRGTDGDFSFERRVNGTNTEFLRIGRGTGNATFAGLADFDSGLTVSVSGSDRFSVTGGDVDVVGTTDLRITGTSRRLSFTSGTGTVRTTTSNSLILQTNSANALVLDSSQNATFSGDVLIEPSSVSSAVHGQNATLIVEATEGQIQIIAEDSGDWASNFVLSTVNATGPAYRHYWLHNAPSTASANAGKFELRTSTTSTAAYIGGQGVGSSALMVVDSSGNTEFSGTVSTAASASNSVPRYTFTGDTDTGLGYIGANSVGLIANGSRKFYINSTTAYFQNLTGGVQIDTDVNVTGNLHAGDGTDIDMDASANGQLEVDGNGYQGAIALNGSAMHIYHNSSSRDLVLGTNETARLTIGGTGTFTFHSNNLQSIGSITATGLDLNGNADISGSLTMSGSHIYMNNFNIYDINTLTFNDPGPNEGISWDGGNTKIYESPDDLTTNSAGNLQFVYGSTRRLTVNSTGIDVNNTITTTYVDAETLKANDSGTTPGACKLHVGSLLSPGSSAVAQLGGFIRMSDQLIIHSGTSSNTVFVKYNGGNIDLTEGEGSGANPATVVNDLISTARGTGWEDQVNLISSDGTNKWNLLVDSGASNYLRFGYNSTDQINFRPDGTIQCDKLIANAAASEFFVAGSSSSQTIVAVIGSTSLRPVLQFSESTATTISSGMSIEYDGRGSGDTNYMAINNVSGSNVFKVYSGGNVHLNSGAKFFFNGTSNYGVGAGGHNYNSVYADTLESGISTDPLELVYYQGRGVNIGSGASKNLGAAAIKLGGADNTVESGYMLHLESTGDAAILLEADTDNVTETDNPKIRFRQDGGAVEAQIMLTSDNDFLIDHIYTANNILFGFNGVTKGTMTNAGNLTMTGNVTAYSDERLKTNIETLDPKKTLQMRGVSFEKEGVKGSGVIAQELEKVAPELVLTNDDEMKTKSVAYGNLVGYLIETIKEQQKDIEYMKSEIKTLKENNNGN